MGAIPEVLLGQLQPDTREFYARVISVLDDSGVPFLAGGTYAFAEYTGIVRCPKDFDIFMRPGDVQRALATLTDAGYRTELTFAHWLGKVHASGDNGDFVDVIFSSGNGVAKVDDVWFEHARRAHLLGKDVRLCPPEESIWSKAFVAERERYDGADVNHLILCCGRGLDWRRLLWRFGPHWHVLLSHLVLFGFVFPSERDVVPYWVIEELMSRLEEESTTLPPPQRVCRGTLLSRSQYAADVNGHGYRDARRDADAGMTAEEIRVWDAAGELPGPEEGITFDNARA